MEKFEITIEKNADGNKADMKNLSLDELKALGVMLNSMSTILENEGAKDAKIAIEEGSIKLVLPLVTAATMIGNFNTVIENKSDNAPLVESYRELKNLFHNSELEFDIRVVNNTGKTVHLLDELLAAKSIRTKNIKRDKDVSLIFITGMIRDIGGLSPNFHVFDKNNKKYKITCTKEEAVFFRNYLYDNIFISAWMTKKPGYSVSYRFNDKYTNVQDFDVHSKINSSAYKLATLDSLELIDDTLTSYFKKKDFLSARKMIKLFNDYSVNNSILKTILINTKSFKNNNEISDIRENIVKILEKKKGSKLV